MERMVTQMTTEQKPKEQPKAAPVTAPVVSEKSLMASLDAALKAGNFKAVAQVSQELVKYQRTQEQAALEAKTKALVAVEVEVKTAIQAVVKKLIDAKRLDIADGVWYTQDFGTTLVTCRLVAVAPKAPRSGNGGGGKKFAVGTAELLQKHGNIEYKDGQSFQAAYDSDPDKNKRYAIREALLKMEGLTS